MGIHSHETLCQNNITSDGMKNSVLESQPYFAKINESILRKSALHLNHYAIQSLDWFMRVKATRGAANGIEQEHVRTETYFHDYNKFTNTLEDSELANIKVFKI
jgi:hypothetical protein